MTTPTVRHATLADAPRMREIYNYAIESRASTCDLEPRDVHEIEGWFSGRDFRSRPIYVAVNDGTITGYLSVSNFWNDRPGYRVAADCGVYLDPAFQGRGIGSTLLRTFLDDAPRLGIRTVVTSMFADNAASVRLFAKFGFDRVGMCTGVADLEGDRKDLAIVQRRITPA